MGRVDRALMAIPTWARTSIFQTAAGVLLVIVAAAAFGAPVWVLVIAAAIGLTAVARVAALHHRRTAESHEHLEQALERLAGAAGLPPEAPARTRTDVPARVDALVDEVSARLDAARKDASSAAAQLEAFPDPLMVIDDSDVVRVCNAGAAQLLDIPPDRTVGRRIEEVFTHADLIQIVAQARRGGEVRLQVRISGPEGARIWDVASAAAGHDVVLALRDVTEQARALQVKTDFVAAASHELRTPIAALRTAVETLGTLGEGDVGMRARLDEMIAQNVARLEEMARDLLDLSRVESPEAPLRTRQVRGAEVEARMKEMFEAVCTERSIGLEFDLAPELESMHTDPELLELILRNLIDNATRFAFEGTTVRVVGRPMPETAGVRLEVNDRGPGIPLAAQQRIFERYFQVDLARTTSRHRRGSGLGLAIVKHAARRLGGTVRVHSVWQQGTTMTVELPGVLEQAT